MGFYGGTPGKSFIITKVFRHYGEMYDEATRTTIAGYFEFVPPGCFALISYGLLESPEYYANIQLEKQWFLDHSMPDDSGKYDATVWAKVFDSDSQIFKYNYISTIGPTIPEIINGNWYIAGIDTGVNAVGRSIELKVELDDENTPSQDFIYWKYTDETEWKVLVELTGLTNLTAYAETADAAQKIARSYADGTGGIDRVDSEGNPISEKVANAKYYMEQTSTLAVESEEQLAQSTQILTEANAMLADVEEDVQVLRDLIEGAPWEEMSGAEVVQARSGAPVLNIRLNRFLYQFDLLNDMKICNYLKAQDAAVVFGNSHIGDIDSIVYKVYTSSLDPELAIDLIFNTEDNKYYMLLPNGKQQESIPIALTNGLFAYPVALFAGSSTEINIDSKNSLTGSSSLLLEQADGKLSGEVIWKSEGSNIPISFEVGDEIPSTIMSGKIFLNSTDEKLSIDIGTKRFTFPSITSIVSDDTVIKNSRGQSSGVQTIASILRTNGDLRTTTFDLNGSTLKSTESKKVFLSGSMFLGSETYYINSDGATKFLSIEIANGGILTGDSNKLLLNSFEILTYNKVNKDAILTDSTENVPSEYVVLTHMNSAIEAFGNNLGTSASKDFGIKTGNIPEIGTDFILANNAPIVIDADGKLKTHESGALGMLAFKNALNSISTDSSSPYSANYTEAVFMKNTTNVWINKAASLAISNEDKSKFLLDSADSNILKYWNGSDWTPVPVAWS